MRRPHVPPRRSARLLGRLCMLLLACGGLLGLVPDAVASDITVNSTSDTSDPGKCRLRDAILAANTDASVNGCPAGQPGLDTIHFNWGLIFCPLTGCQVKLMSPLPQITEDLTIDGTGQNPTINGNHFFRIFDFDGVTANLSNLYLVDGKNANGGAIHVHGTILSLDHVHISNSQATTSGGAIQTVGGGTLFVSHSDFISNTAVYGGAIETEDGTLSINHSDFISNTAGSGGAIYLYSGIGVIASSSFTANVASHGGGAVAAVELERSRLDVSGSLFDGNRAGSAGGAVSAQGLTAQTSLASSTFTNNQALTTTANVGGGAIYNDGVLTLTASTLANNVSASEGGALYDHYGQATIRNSTFSGNTAQRSGGAISAFGASATTFAQLSLNNVTLSANTADLDHNNSGDGGGLAVASDFVTATVTNTILAGDFDTPNKLGGGTIHPDCSGELAALHFSLVGLSEGCTVLSGHSSNNQVGNGLDPLDARLGLLADNGGPTQTRALLDGSPALNHGSPAAPGSGGLACEAADQRGVLRPLGSVCDVGAFEAGMRTYLPAIRR